MPRASRGVVLIEVLAATLILATAGIGLMELVAGGLRAIRAAVVREHELADEERLLTAYALLDRADLERDIGPVRVGPYVVTIERPERSLYRVALGRVETRGVEDLVTVVYRPEAGDAP